jgi:hypothetical protein
VNTHNNFLPRPPEYRRRQILDFSRRAIVLGASANFLSALDSWGADLKYGNWHTSKITDVVAPEQAPRAKEAWLVFTGMGTASGGDAAQHLKGMLPPRTPISYVEYNPAGVDIPNVAQKMGEHLLRMHHVNPDMQVSFMGLSAGNAVEKAAVYHLMEQERIAVRPAREMQISSPWLPRNVEGSFERFMSNLLHGASEAGIDGGWAFAEIGGVVQVVRDQLKKNGQPPLNGDGDPMTAWELIKASDERASHSQPVKLWLSLNETIHNVDHYNHLGSLAVSRAACHSLLWCSGNDQVVEMPQAAHDGQAIFGAAGLTIPKLYEPSVEAGPANIAAVSADYTVQRWLKETGPPPEPLFV